jgi:hypothetical protein
MYFYLFSLELITYLKIILHIALTKQVLVPLLASGPKFYIIEKSEMTFLNFHLT